MNENITIYEHKTKSLDELAVLLAVGAEVVNVDRSAKFFEFTLRSKSIDLEKKTLELASRTLVINAADLLAAYKRAKSISHTRSNSSNSVRIY